MPPEMVIHELISSGCPSIQYRARRELLDEATDSQMMKAIQREILQDEHVEAILESQAADGWIGSRFHGYDSHEAGIRLLCEKGLDREHPSLGRALEALDRMKARIDAEMGIVGRTLDESGLGGTETIRATILAYAGEGTHPLLKVQQGLALDAFRAVSEIGSVDEITEPYKDKLVFKEGVIWPSIYHLRLLAFTHAWRTPQAQAMLVESTARLAQLSPIPNIHVRFKSQCMAPAAFGMQNFGGQDLARLTAPEWMMWFQRMELLARLGVVKEAPELRRQVEELDKILVAGGGWFTLPLTHDYFRNWGAYTGLMLERDWRHSKRRVYDLTFRSLLIQHYSGL
jgi:hypothetical protein